MKEPVWRRGKVYILVEQFRGRQKLRKVMVKENLVEKVIEVERLDGRVMKIAVTYVDRRYFISFWYIFFAPQQGRPKEEKSEYL